MSRIGETIVAPATVLTPPPGSLTECGGRPTDSADGPARNVGGGALLPKGSKESMSTGAPFGSRSETALAECEECLGRIRCEEYACSNDAPLS